MPRATISKRFTFDAAHHLPTVPEGHKCRRMHGHTYKVDLIFAGLVDDMGFVLDYEKIAEAWQPIHEVVDHQLLNEIIPVPSTENLVMWMWQRLGPLWPGLQTIRISESSTTWCEMDREEAYP